MIKSRGKNPSRFRHRRLASPRLFRPGSFRTVTPRGRPDVRVVVAKRRGSGRMEAPLVYADNIDNITDPVHGEYVDGPVGVEIRARHSRWRLPMSRKAAYEFSRRWQGPGRAQVYERKTKRGNPASGLVEIYPRVTRVEMQKGSGAAKPVRNGRFYHDFKPGTRALGLPRGARIVDARGRPLKSLGKRSILLVNEE